MLWDGSVPKRPLPWWRPDAKEGGGIPLVVLPQPQRQCAYPYGVTTVKLTPSWGSDQVIPSRMKLRATAPPDSARNQTNDYIISEHLVHSTVKQGHRCRNTERQRVKMSVDNPAGFSRTLFRLPIPMHKLVICERFKERHSIASFDPQRVKQDSIFWTRRRLSSFFSRHCLFNKIKEIQGEFRDLLKMTWVSGLHHFQEPCYETTTFTGWVCSNKSNFTAI